MIDDTRRPTAPCANEACPRPAEEGEIYCAACGLERSLYRRDSRQAAASPDQERAEPVRR